MKEFGKSSRVRWRGALESRSEAQGQLQMAGDVALVNRGQLRWMLMSCPCGCGEIIAVNLDRRAGPAWRVRNPGPRISVYPSVWRDSGCGSHFVVSGGRILMMGTSRGAHEWLGFARDLPERVAEKLDKQPRHFADIAAELDADPWEVWAACWRLVESGQAVEEQGTFARAPEQPPSGG